MLYNLLDCVKILIALTLLAIAFGLACVTVWAAIAATIKTWNVLLGRDRFSWKDTVNWFRKLPRWTKEGSYERAAFWNEEVARGNDFLYPDLYPWSIWNDDD